MVSTRLSHLLILFLIMGALYGSPMRLIDDWRVRARYLRLCRAAHLFRIGPGLNDAMKQKESG